MWGASQLNWGMLCIRILAKWHGFSRPSALVCSVQFQALDLYQELYPSIFSPRN